MKWALAMMPEELIRIGAKVVRHSGYVLFQVVPRLLVRQILGRIERLRASPELTRA